jgi:hypothetical protein
MSYLDENLTIRKTVSNLINTHVRHGGMESWPEILNFLLKNLDTNRGVEMSLQTLNIIIEDSGSHLEEKFAKFLMQLTSKLLNFLTTSCESNIDVRNESLITLTLATLYVLLESCPNVMSENLDHVINVLSTLSVSQNLQTRYHLGRCWLCILRMKKDIIFSLNAHLFPFFMNNFSVDYYEMNFTSAEFFLMIIETCEEEEEEIGSGAGTGIGVGCNSEEGVGVISRFIQENLKE